MWGNLLGVFGNQRVCQFNVAIGLEDEHSGC